MFTAPDSPFEMFSSWFGDASRSEPNDPNAMSLATADKDGRPSVRMMLLKGVDEKGFVFYTNLESIKGNHLKENPFAAICFHWKTLTRQVRAQGPVEAVTAAEADAYFASRPRASRIGAWASIQSRELGARAEFDERIARFEDEYKDAEVPRPPHWSGFRLVPERVEFWLQEEFRLHRRLVYTRQPGGGWRTGMLYP